MTKGSTIDRHVREHSEVMAKRQPRPDDALNFAAIRWYVNRIENHALGVYCSCPTALPPIRDALFECLDALAEIECREEQACPDGYHREGNMCVPDNREE